MKLRENRVFLFALGLGLAAWVVDSINDYLFFYKGYSFLGVLILNPPPHELYIRSVILLFFIIFGLIVSGVLAKQRLIEEALKNARDELERMVAERTSELKSANDQMRIELNERIICEEALRESERHLRYLSSERLMAQEKERTRIARELHDELGQSLAVLKLRLGFIEKRVPEDQPKLKEECQEGSRYINQIIEDVRRLSHNLSPSVLEDLGLSAALRWLIDNYAKQSGVKVSTALSEIDHLFSRKTQVFIFRIFQEALTNIEKHAQATELSVSVHQQNGSVTFALEDNGRGFVKTQADKKGLGLTTMNERVQILGGFFDIQSREGKGTRILFDAPIEKTGGE